MRHFITSVVISTLIAFTAVSTQSAWSQTFTILHTFTGGQDGAYPEAGLTTDKAGNLYGTAAGSTPSGGYYGYGTVFKLTHKSGGWIFAPLYGFAGGSDGSRPWAAVVIGASGSLYGTTALGGAGGCYAGCGTVFNLRPAAHAQPNALAPWVETILYSFQGVPDGRQYPSRVTFDQSGNIYLTTFNGGVYDHGAVIEVLPSNGGWTDSVLYSFTGGNDGESPSGGLIFDQVGNRRETPASCTRFHFANLTIFPDSADAKPLTDSEAQDNRRNNGDDERPQPVQR